VEKLTRVQKGELYIRVWSRGQRHGEEYKTVIISGSNIQSCYRSCRSKLGRECSVRGCCLSAEHDPGITFIFNRRAVCANASRSGRACIA
jgi:hypothetical protein